MIKILYNKKICKLLCIILIIFLLSLQTFASSVINNTQNNTKSNQNSVSNTTIITNGVDIHKGEKKEEVKKYFTNSEIYMLHSVTNAQCLSMIIKDCSNNIIVIDGGWEADKNHLIETIKKLSDHVDAWLITHEDPDHVGAINAILKDETNPINITKIYRDVYIPLDIVLGTTRISLLNNPFICKEDPVNNSSRCFRILLENKIILITGDLGQEGGNNLMKTVDVSVLKADFLQMPHHGAHYTMVDFYKSVSPTVCLYPTYNGSHLSNDKVARTKAVMKNLGVQDNFFVDKEDIIIK